MFRSFHHSDMHQKFTHSFAHFLASYFLCLFVLWLLSCDHRVFKRTQFLLSPEATHVFRQKIGWSGGSFLQRCRSPSANSCSKQLGLADGTTDSLWLERWNTAYLQVLAFRDLFSFYFFQVLFLFTGIFSSLGGHHALAGHVTTSVGRAAGGVAEAARQLTRLERRQRAKDKAERANLGREKFSRFKKEGLFLFIFGLCKKNMKIWKRSHEMPSSAIPARSSLCRSQIAALLDSKKLICYGIMYIHNYIGI